MEFGDGYGTKIDMGGYSDYIVASPNGDCVLVGGLETYASDVAGQLRHCAARLLDLDYEEVGEPTKTQRQALAEYLEAKLGVMDLDIEVYCMWLPKTGWLFMVGNEVLGGRTV